MKRYLISFDDGAMDHIPERELPGVSEAARAVVRAAKAAGVWVFGGGLPRQQSAIVSVSGHIANAPFPETKPVVGGFAIVEVSSQDEALAWAAKLSAACRCPQDVREIGWDPES